MARSDGNRTVTLTLDVDDKGQAKLKKFREEVTKTDETLKKVKRPIEEFADANKKAGDGIAFAFVKANIFLGLLKGAWTVAMKVAGLAISFVTKPVSLLRTGITLLIKETLRATEAYNEFRISLEGALKSAERSRQISGFVQEFALKTPVRVQEIQDLTKSIALIPALKPTFFGDFEEVKKNLGSLYDTVIGLRSLNPQQGIPGAVFAIREALTGQFRSLRARFDIMPEIVAGAIGKTVGELKKSPKLVIEALKAFVDQNVGEDTIRELGKAVSVRIGNIGEALKDIAPRQIGEAGFYSFFSNILGVVDDQLQGFFGAGGRFETDYAPKISDGLKRVLFGVVRIVGTVFGATFGELGDNDILSNLSGAVVKILDSVADKIDALATNFENNRKQITDFFTSIVDAMSSGVDLFFKLIDNLPAAASVLTSITNSVGGVLKAAISVSDSVSTLSFTDSGISNKLINKTVADYNYDTESPINSGRASLIGGLTLRQRAIGEYEDAISGKSIGVGPTGSLGVVGDRLSRALQATYTSAEKFADAVEERAKLEESIGRLTSANFDFDQTLKEKTASAKSGESTTIIDVNTGERVVFTTFNDDLKRITGKSGIETSRDALDFRNEFDKIKESGGAANTIFGGSVAGITNLGLKQQEKLNKILLTPLEDARRQFLENEEQYNIGIEKLAENRQLLISTVNTSTKAAESSLLDYGMFFDEFTPAVLRKWGEKIRESASFALKKIDKESDLAADLAYRSRSVANVASLQTAIDVLGKTDPRNLKEFDSAFAAFTDRLERAKPIILDAGLEPLDSYLALLKNLAQESNNSFLSSGGFTKNILALPKDPEGFEELKKLEGLISIFASDDDRKRLEGYRKEVETFIKVLGTSGVDKLAQQIVGGRTQEFDRISGLSASLGGGGGPKTALAQAKERLDLIQKESAFQKRIFEFLDKSKIVDTERKRLISEINRLTKDQTDQLSIGVTAQEYALQESERNKLFQRTLGDAYRKNDRVSLLNDEAERLNANLAEMKKVLSGNDGEAMADLLGISKDVANRGDIGRSGIVGRLEATETALEGINEQVKGMTKGDLGVLGNLFGTGGNFTTLLEESSAYQDSVRDMGRIGAELAGHFIDSYGLAITERLEDGTIITRLKTFSEAVEDGVVDFATAGLDSLQSTVGDSVEALFTGNLKGIMTTWSNFFSNLLSMFGKFVAELLIKKAALSFLQSIFGGATSVGGLSSLPAVGGAGADPSLGSFFSAKADGDIVGPGAGGAVLAMVGEGRTKEAIIPMVGDSIPARMTPGGLMAVLPDGRTIPVSMGFAGGGVTPGRSAYTRMPSYQSEQPIYVINTVDPVEAVAAGLPANARIVENQVYGSLRNRGKVHQGMSRYR